MLKIYQQNFFYESVLCKIAKYFKKLVVTKTLSNRNGFT